MRLENSLRILWLATKTPWPANDGGRLLLLNTLRALWEAGHHVTLLAPITGGSEQAKAARAQLEAFCRPVLVSVRARTRFGSWLRSRAGSRPSTVVRHEQPAVRRALSRALAVERFDLVQIEQVHAFAMAREAVALSIRAGGAGPALFVRAQNVESTLWHKSARGFWPRAWLLAREARRMERYERMVIAAAAGVFALTADDAAHLAMLGGRAVSVIPAPFPVSLPASERRLDGKPCVVLFGSAGWRPNHEGTVWFLREVWPRVRERWPGACLHLFGVASGAAASVREASIRVHPSPADSVEAFPAGALQVVPLLTASGVRMKILEAWARGNPVVATAEAARGLDARCGRELLVAGSAEEMADAIGRLHEDPALCSALVDAGHEALRRAHDPARIADAIVELYLRARPEVGAGAP